MRILKYLVIILSFFCYIAVALYLLCVMPLLFGYTHQPITDSSLSELLPEDAEERFAPGSMFYYTKEGIEEVGRGEVVVYKTAESSRAYGIVAENDGAVLKLHGTGETVFIDNVIGVRATICFPVVGAYVNFLQSNLFVIVLVGVILALRIFFIYYDPEKKAKKKRAEDNDELEAALEKMLEKRREEKTQSSKQSEVFAVAKEETEVKDDTDVKSEEEPKDEVLTMQELVNDAQPVESKPEAEPERLDDILRSEIAQDKQTAVLEEKDPTRETVVAKEAPAFSITKYIAELEFDSKDNRWYDASQVDSALDEICERFADAVAAAAPAPAVTEDTETKKELYDLSERYAKQGAELSAQKAHSAELEKHYLELEAENAKAKEAILSYEEEIKKYKIMEQKVAKLVAELKAQKAD